MTRRSSELDMREFDSDQAAVSHMVKPTGETEVAKLPPVFIVGAQRSGTTVLQLALSKHSNLAIAFETNFLLLSKQVATCGDLTDQSNRLRLLAEFAADSRISEADVIRDWDGILAHEFSDLRGFIDAVFTEYAKSRSKGRWGVKCPGWVAELDQLWKLFPGCKIIHIVRDGRDVALSLRRVSWGLKHIPYAAEDWRWKVTLGRKMGAMIAEDYYEIRYEDFVLDPEARLRGICDFLREPFEPAMLEYHRSARDELPERSLRWHQSSVSPLDPNKAYEWKHTMSRSDRVIFERLAGDALQLFGYECEGHEHTAASRLKSLYYTLWKRW